MEYGAAEAVGRAEFRGEPKRDGRVINEEPDYE